MKTYFEFETVNCDDIDTDDRRYKITNDMNCQDLAESVARFGLLSPPLLSKQENGYVLISGFRRIEALRICGLKSCGALVADSLNDLECALISVQDNALQRRLALSEQIRSVRMIASFFSRHENNDAFYKTVCEALNIPLNKQYVLKLWKASGMSESLLKLVANEHVSLEVVLDILELDSVAQEKMHSILAQFKISVSKQKEFLLQVSEVAAREKLPVSEVLDDVFSIASQCDYIQDMNARFSELRAYLQRRRYPAMTHILDKQDNLVSRLRIPNGMKLNIPDSLEGSTYSFQLSFRSIQDLNEMKKKLDLICLKPEMEMILGREYA